MISDVEMSDVETSDVLPNRLNHEDRKAPRRTKKFLQLLSGNFPWCFQQRPTNNRQTHFRFFRKETPIVLLENRSFQTETPILFLKNRTFQTETPILFLKNRTFQTETPILLLENRTFQTETPILLLENRIFQEETPILFCLLAHKQPANREEFFKRQAQ